VRGCTWSVFIKIKSARRQGGDEQAQTARNTNRAIVGALIAKPAATAASPSNAASKNTGKSRNIDGPPLFVIPLVPIGSAICAPMDIGGSLNRA
jgi:hypothetical protein